jgi:catechol 2,3-dioxygenase-like lactoylglutathione lyase family enzyme
MTLDFVERASFRSQHFAFFVGDAEFDAALARLSDAGAAFYADVDRYGRCEINRLCSGRGVYFDDPNGHPFESISRPYGPKPERWAKLSR